MKKFFISILVIVGIVTIIYFISQRKVEVGSAEEFKKVLDRSPAIHIIITDDFEITGDSRNIPSHVSNKKVEGNGHTITVVSTYDSINFSNYYHAGVMAEVENCTIKDLNIVYDVKVSEGNGSDNEDYYFGGLAASAKNSTFENCTVTFKDNCYVCFKPGKYVTSHDDSVGGLIGCGENVKIINCKVSGNLIGNAGYFGGLAGCLTGESVIRDSVFEGSIKIEEGVFTIVGGIAGFLEGECYSSKAVLNYLEVENKNNFGQGANVFCGGLIGIINGNLHDCYVKFPKNSYYKMLNHQYAFSTKTCLTNGFVCGGGNGTVNNIYVDCNDDINSNRIYCDDKNDAFLGVAGGKITALGYIVASTTPSDISVANVYFVDSAYDYKFEQGQDLVPSSVPGGFIFEFEVEGETAIVNAKKEYNSKMKRWEPVSGTLTIGEKVYTFQDFNVYNYGDDNLFEMIVFDGGIEHKISYYSVDFALYHVTYRKNAKYINDYGCNFVTSFDEIKFTNADEYWEFDSQTSKPLLKSIDMMN